MDLTIILTGIGTVLTIIGFVYGILRNFKDDIKTDMTIIKTDISNLESDIREDMRAHSSRIDKLYEMFVQLQRENNELLRSLLKQPRTEP